MYIYIYIHTSVRLRVVGIHGSRNSGPPFNFVKMNFTPQKYESTPVGLLQFRTPGFPDSHSVSRAHWC